MLGTNQIIQGSCEQRAEKGEFLILRGTLTRPGGGVETPEYFRLELPMASPAGFGGAGGIHSGDAGWAGRETSFV